MNKKLLSGIMSGVMLAGSCSAVGAEAPKASKNSVLNFVSNHKIAIGGATGLTVISGAIAGIVLHNRNIKVDFSKFDNFDEFMSNLVGAVKAFKNSLTISNVTVSNVRSIRAKLAEAFVGELGKAKDEEAKKVVLKFAGNVEGLKGLVAGDKGTLVLKKVTKEDKTVEVTFEFKAEEKAEDKKVKAEVLRIEAPKAEDKKDEVEAEAPKAEEKDEVKTEAPKAEEKDEVEVEAPKAEENKNEVEVEAPKAEENEVEAEAPKAEENEVEVEAPKAEENNNEVEANQ